MIERGFKIMKQKNEGINVKRYATILAIVILCMGITLAVFMNYYNKSINAYVVGGSEVLVIQKDLSDFTLNCSGGSANNSQTLRLFSYEDIDLNATIDITKIVNVEGCDFENDCTIGLFNLSGSEIQTDNMVSILANDYQDLELKAVCLKNSCPQNISISIQLIEI